eukprot:COSAG05_NODE_828_length_7101_cov_4.298915_1_plen_98_part_00
MEWAQVSARDPLEYLQGYRWQNRKRRRRSDSKRRTGIAADVCDGGLLHRVQALATCWYRPACWTCRNRREDRHKRRARGMSLVDIQANTSTTVKHKL